MRVFILAPERSGTTTFYKACKHITNYVTSHETNQNSLAKHLNMTYPDNHIEIDNRLVFNLGYLDRFYGDSVFVVLYRPIYKNIYSLMKRFHDRGSIVEGYMDNIIGVRPELASEKEKHQAAWCYTVSTRNNIRLFLKGKKDIFTILIEDPEVNFIKFWKFIGAEGDLQAALNEFRVKHNNSEDKKYRYLVLWELKLLFFRLKKKWQYNHHLKR